jgi:predicted aspartyl protease
MHVRLFAWNPLATSTARSLISGKLFSDTFPQHTRHTLVHLTRALRGTMRFTWDSSLFAELPSDDLTSTDLRPGDSYFSSEERSPHVGLDDMKQGGMYTLPSEYDLRLEDEYWCDEVRGFDHASDDIEQEVQHTRHALSRGFETALPSTVFWVDALCMDKGVPVRNATSERIRTQAKSPNTFEEPTIAGRLQGVDVSAFPDTGAAANYISLLHAQRHGLTINQHVGKHIKVGDGSTIRAVGTTTLPFSFAGERTTYNLTFHILRQSVHDIILGSTFLRTSETFTRFRHRLGRKIRKAVSHGIHRICLLGSQQYVKGVANGVSVDAVPDTGADVSVMSARFAKANGFKIKRNKRHRITLSFADGSTARADGVVKGMGWRFDSDEQTHPTDVYVLSSLPVDLVLSWSFLCQTNAFLEHQHDFWCVEELGLEDVSMLCIIQAVEKAKKGDREQFCEYRCGVVPAGRSDI